MKLRTHSHAKEWTLKLLVELTKMSHRPVEGWRASWRRFSPSWALHDPFRLLTSAACLTWVEFTLLFWYKTVWWPQLAPGSCARRLCCRSLPSGSGVSLRVQGTARPLKTLVTFATTPITVPAVLPLAQQGMLPSFPLQRGAHRNCSLRTYDG